AIALVPQDYAFYPMLDVGENLRFFGGVLGLSGPKLKAQIDSAIAFARLEQVVSKRAEQLSGGLRRRLNLAIGLLGQPQLLLLDEPTVGVDPQSRHFLLDSIAALPAAGTTVIYTSHYMEEVEAICQKIAIIDQGKVLAEGTLNDILRSAEPALELQLGQPLPDDIATRYQAVAENPLKYRLNLPATAALPRLLDELTAAGCTVDNLNLGQHNLEQVFMRLTKRSLRD
ncbi:MAG TPA: ABC transporter ATP-binding protein, partial [Azonexus sp.]|nr:ABC transporter ATP-binding protein [Azonexus sp.]